ncbi:hypothetical protein Pth03_76590 [Planotetraspora thailandica]|uniref:Resolvase/invertase-type recombinase catalytic domain-containing protein n=1 Tax=Planotetraspora thailandica TaxID=487172 RepID=A0A8J3Y1R5_9ACTN|nr:hypothetical protein [Planotetraspora thailandica]GII59270.1 hypothetical protein Pth03_76590 [Planotetraspora thailandica]
MSDLVPVVSYARISADIKGDEHGVQDQHKVNGETARRHGWTVVHEYTDNDKSAAKAGRYIRVVRFRSTAPRSRSPRGARARASASTRPRRRRRPVWRRVPRAL